MSKAPAARLRIVKENGEPVLYVEVKEGRRFMRIAKRYSGQNWINLEPGYRVYGSEPGANNGTLEIEYDGQHAGAN